MPVTIKFDPNSINIQSATIQNATPLSDGVMSKEQAAQLVRASSDTSALAATVAANKAQTDAEIATLNTEFAASQVVGPIPPSGGLTGAPPYPYVIRYARPTGNDVTGDGSLAKPYLTPDRAVQDCPQNLDGRMFRVDMTGYGTYSPTQPLVLPTVNGGRMDYFAASTDPESIAFGYYKRADVELYAAPTIVLDLPAGSYTVSASSTAAGHAILTVAGANWTVNEWADKIVASAGNLLCDRVISNNANSITITNPASFLDNSQDIKLAVESCTIELNPSTIAYTWLAGEDIQTSMYATLTVAGFNFTGISPSSGGDSDFGLFVDRVNYIGCKNLITWSCTAERFAINGCIILTMQSISRRTEVYNCTGGGFSVFSNEANGQLTVLGCYFDEARWPGYGDSIGEGSYHTTSAEQLGARTVAVFYTTRQNTNRGGVRLVGRMNFASVGWCDFNNCGYGGVRMEQGATVSVVGPLSGTGNAAGGVVLLDDSSMYIEQDELNTSTPLDTTNLTLTGTPGNIIFSTGPALSWASVIASKSFVHPSTQAAITQRTPSIASTPRLAVRSAGVNLAVGQLTKITATNTVSVLQQVSASDSPNKITGVVFQTATAGAQVYLTEQFGQEVQLQLDAVGPVTAVGQPLYLSSTVDGAVTTAVTATFIANATVLGAAGSLVAGIFAPR